MANCPERVGPGEETSKLIDQAMAIKGALDSDLPLEDTKADPSNCLTHIMVN